MNVKVAQKRRKRNPFLPVLALMYIFGALVIAYLLINPVTALINHFAPNAGFFLPPPELQFSPQFVMPSTPRIVMTIVIWLILIGLGYMLVGLLAGRDPDTPKAIQMPPKNKEERRRRYSGDD